MNEDALAALVSAYELAQRNRIATAAHVRAGGARCGSAALAVTAGSAALDAMLELERQAERRLCQEMAATVECHPAWPWLEQVRGIGPTLSARLLARLRIERAPTPSSFWSYCGLATVPAVRYRCVACGVVIDLAAGNTAPRRHRSSRGTECDGDLAADAHCGARVAARLPARGRRRTFDVEARTLCHMIGVSFLRRGGRYREVYDARRARLRTDREAWTANRVHLTAMRTMEKLFLAHLWLVWAEARGQQCRAPYVTLQRGARAGVISPWDMVEG